MRTVAAPAFPVVPALMAATVLALGVPMARLAASYPDTAPGGGAPWQVALQAAAAAAAVPVAQARPALLFTIVLAGAALAPALLGAAALTCPVGPLRSWDRLAGGHHGSCGW